tara:strand:+ start:122 stop:1273 length:1152 start_codon:yes stop_codon:yes gene_type:complete
MFNSKDIIEALSDKEFSVAENITKKGLAKVSLSYIDHIKNAVSKTIMTEEEDPPDKEDVQGTEEDPTLDPALDREYFLKSWEENGILVTIKTIGVGKNKPVSVYFDDVRWEMFPGPVNAEKHAKEFIKSKQYDLWRGRKGLKDIESSEEDNKKTEVKESVNFLEAIDMTVGGKTFTVSIANTPESLQKGLMHEKSMDSNKGVLLVFDESERHGIWMKNTHIPLDVIWITESGTVLEVQRLEPHDEEIKYPHTPAKYVLELNAGEFTGKIGDQIKLEDSMVNEITIQEQRKNTARASTRRKNESVLNTLTKIVESQKPSLAIFDDGNSLKVEPEIAMAILAVHEALNKRNKIKLQKIINKNSSGFKEVTKFSCQNLLVDNKKQG